MLRNDNYTGDLPGVLPEALLIAIYLYISFYLQEVKQIANL